MNNHSYLSRAARALLVLCFAVLGLTVFSPASFAQGPINAVDSKGKVADNGAFTTSGTYVSDFGLRAETNSLPFDNYGAGPYTNLTPAEMRRVLGDQACESINNGNCVLHPQIKEIMDAWNKSMEGGHCYGFSVAALQFYQNKLNPADFGGTSIADLKIDGNDKLSREIAYSFVYQYAPAVKAARIAGTPNEVLDQLTQALQPGASAPESYTIGFFKAEGGGGHAVTPYAIEDLGGGINAVLVYDNNWPKQPRAILFDRNANKWSYQASINPAVPSEVYWGDATTQSLFLYPTTPGTKPFASLMPSQGRVPGMAAPAQQLNTIFLEASAKNHAHLLITDDKGKRLGFTADGKFVNEISGADAVAPFSDTPTTWNEAEEPIYYVPTTTKFTLTIDGTPLKQESSANIVMVGPGYDIGLDDVILKPGQKDVLTLSSDGTQLSYKTDSSESPNIILGVDGKDADYAFVIKGVDLDGGGTINATLDTTKGQLSFNTSGTKAAGTFGMLMERIDAQTDQVFWHDAITLSPGDVARVNYGKWTGDKTSLTVDVDHGSTGTNIETLTLTDDEQSTTTPHPAAKTDATPLTKNADLDKTATDIAKWQNFANFVYEAWQLPATATWDDTFSYYNDQMKQLSWDGQGSVEDYPGGTVGSWVNDSTKTGLIVLFVASPDGTKPAYVIAVFGQAKTP